MSEKIKRCPQCGAESFYVSVHVVQDWKVDSHGTFLEAYNECSEVTHRPDNDDFWECTNCGYEAPGGEFECDVLPVVVSFDIAHHDVIYDILVDQMGLSQEVFPADDVIEIDEELLRNLRKLLPNVKFTVKNAQPNVEENLDNGCTKILIRVRGGLVEEVYCSDMNAEVYIDDLDVSEEEKDDGGLWLDGSPIDENKLTQLY